MYYFTSDLHFCHNKEFLFNPRGFKNVYDMNNAIVTNWNSVVNMEDDVYVLGDIMLNDNDEGIRLLKQLKGKIHIILGNHDTNTRVELYKNCYNVVEVDLAARLKYNKYHFFLTHYPCCTSNMEKESLKQATISLSGHTHSKDKFIKNFPYSYNVAVDAHNCTPVSIDQIIEDLKEHLDKIYKE